MDNQSPAYPGARSLRALIDLFSSIRLGIVLIALIIVYSTVGSAIPPTRQFFELTEFQFFNHPVFVVLIGLFALNLTATTVRRIRFNLRNAGVLTVHTGLLLLCAGSVIYFGQKIEGDVLLNPPRINVMSVSRIRAGENPILASFAAVEGKTWTTNMPALGGRYSARVTKVRHKGMTPASDVELEVAIGEGVASSLSLSQSAPGTEAAQRTDLARLNEQILLQLEPANTADRFFDNQTPLLTVGYDDAHVSYELPQLPYYTERFVDREGEREPVLDSAGRGVPSARTTSTFLEKWRMPIRLDRSGSAVASDWPFTIEIDGYLPYAELRTVPCPGGERENPVVRYRLNVPNASDDQWLSALLPRASMMDYPDGTAVEFRWIGDGTALEEAWTSHIEGTQVLDVVVKDKNIRRQYDVREGQTISVEGTDYVLSVEQLRPDWPLMTASHKDAKTPTALVWVKSPAGEFQRSVLQRYPELDQDRDRGGKKILADRGLVDENIEIRYFDASRHHFLIAAGHSLAPTVVHTAPGGQRTIQRLETGQPYAAGSSLGLTLLEIIEKPLVETRPEVVLEQHRRPLGDIRRAKSLMRVHVRGAEGGTALDRRVWVPFSQYNDRFPGDVGPTEVEIGDGKKMTLVYGRAERPLPGPVVLEKLETTYYPGRERPSNWRSWFRYEDPITKEPMRTSCWLNNTARVGGWTLFQATAANDGETFTGLGVGNRDGVLTMLAGCVCIAMGLIYAFTVKPAMIRSMKRKALQAASRDGSGNGDGSAGGPHGRRRAAAGAMAISSMLVPALVLFCSNPARSEDAPARKPSSGVSGIDELRRIQPELDIKTLGALVVQYNARFSSVEAWARDTMEMIHGPGKHPLGLDPVVAAMELMFNPEAYVDEPLIYVKDRGLRRHITSDPVKLSDAETRRILKDGMVSLRFLFSPPVHRTLSELETDTRFNKAMGRLNSAINGYRRIAESFAIVPSASLDASSPWHTMDDLVANLPDASGATQDAEHAPVPGIAAAQASGVLNNYRDLIQGWRARDATRINRGIHELESGMTALAPAGHYPEPRQRHAEVTYYRLELIWWAWVVYIVAFFFGIFSVATHYRWVGRTVIALLALAIGLHWADLILRWYIVGRIPNANMWEAIVFSTGVGAVLGLLLEVFSGKRVFGLATAFLGFFALALPELNVLGITNRIDTMMPILDDVMLRIHTVLIISSYAVITLAFGVANCYLVVAALRQRSAAAQATLGAQVGALLCLVAVKMGWVPDENALILLGVMATLTAGGAMLAIPIIPLLRPRQELALAGGGFPVLSADLMARAEDDEVSGRVSGGGGAHRGDPAPSKTGILKEFDLCQRVLLYIAMVALFVGIVLGAMWADYSWGRPWGWDPKEVFALNTWLVYAILIHSRFVTKDKALWTSILSVVGFAAMQFNWWVVNFYIVGLHSYA